MVGVLTLSFAPTSVVSRTHAAVPVRLLVGQTPDTVVRGGATLLRRHDLSDTLTVDIGLAVRSSSALDALIVAASDPASPGYGQYLTPAQYMAQFAPLPQEVSAVEAWATSVGLSVTSVSPDNLLVVARGTTGQVEQALSVTINDYQSNGLDYRSNDRDATVPADLHIRAISGLSTIHRFHTLARPAASLRNRAGGYFPGDFRTAYNMPAVGDGSGQTIGFTLWGTSVAQSDLNTFASQTGTSAIVGGQGGANGIEWLAVNGGSADTNELVETAMDVEFAHGAAPNSHLKYWLSDCTPSAGSCNPSDVGLEQAISAAANDTTLHVVSNSWGGGEAASQTDPFVSNTNASLQHAAGVGTTFYFSSGDTGSNSGGTGLASYPADSPYVVSVGGTTLNTTSGFAYSSESAWNGSGGGCSSVFPRPSWQTGVGAATCTGRAEPDVAADADPATGAYVYVQGSGQAVGGTSLAAPLWSGMAADVNRYLGAIGRPLMGFAAPRLYALATSSATYSRDFHDVTTGNNGYPAGVGWDEATGWGSPNLANLAADWSGGIVQPTNTPVPAATNTPAPGATNTPVPTATNTPVPTATNTPVPAATATSTPSGGGTCTSDNVCLTSFTASAASVPVNTLVTLRATTGTDVGPTPYYILILDETGAVLTNCSTGTTCSTTVTSATAATHRYTAALSTSSTSNTANAQSPAVSVTWTSGPTATATLVPTKTPITLPTNTPIAVATASRTPLPVATATSTRTPAATATSTSAPLPTATPPSGNIIVNPGFESGPGVGWSEYSSGGYELVDTYRPHTGSYSADQCNYNSCTEYVQQRITVPSNAGLRYWWYMTSSEPTTTAYDYLRVQVYSTGGTLLGTLRAWSNTSTRNAWSPDTLSLAAYAGQTVLLRFTTTTDYTQPTNFFIDDVAVP